ncbi:hypothetical protein GMRT_11677 [Giardia muris]|uniref:Uncharacterized protein n=1 Tax=Giardia muris TaxID=5742 RepID=A0A4Z1T1F2_GIAMU|nr:hypothetical protein GMRT_11677 [Giardia muris]|eukprot:TNJ29528.1 hypothetical protein GMRT_11677 [Giardia muris]
MSPRRVYSIGEDLPVGVIHFEAEGQQLYFQVDPGLSHQLPELYHRLSLVRTCLTKEEADAEIEALLARRKQLRSPSAEKALERLRAASHQLVTTLAEHKGVTTSSIVKFFSLPNA